MRLIFVSLFLIIVGVFFISTESCRKPSVADITGQPSTPPTNNKPDTTGTPHGSDTTAPKSKVTGNWECDVDGIHYSGTIDTSFIQTGSNQTYPDTMFECTGTSSDKNANIHFRFEFNRRYMSYTNFNLLTLDTCTDYFWQTNTSWATSTYNIDSLVSNKIYVSFSGKVTDAVNYYSGATHVITNGKFSCVFGNGNSEPKSFSYTANGTNVAGYFNYARITSNALILDGLPYGADAQARFKLIVRTGGTLKTGTYESAKGDVGLQRFLPSYYRDYVNDSLGDLKVTISSITGNVVNGVFSGTNRDGTSISNGRFSCRVKNYQPQADSLNKWSFGEDEPTFNYRIFGGNVLNANLSQDAGRYKLTLNGESDNGQSVFKVVISSNTQITTGVYQTGISANSKIDSLYFKSPTKIWNGNSTYLYIDDYDQAFGGSTFCSIDAIDGKNVTGTLYGKIHIFFSSGGSTSAYIREGKFRGSFY